MLYFGQSVFHYHHRDRCELIHIYCEDTIHPGNVGAIIVFLNVFHVGWKNSQHLFDFQERHCFQNEALVISKEEETSTGSGTQTGILNLLDIH